MTVHGVYKYSLSIRSSIEERGGGGPQLPPPATRESDATDYNATAPVSNQRHRPVLAEAAFHRAVQT